MRRLGKFDLIERSRQGMIALVSDERAFSFACIGLGIILVTHGIYQVITDRKPEITGEL